MTELDGSGKIFHCFGVLALCKVIDPESVVGLRGQRITSQHIIHDGLLITPV